MATAEESKLNTIELSQEVSISASPTEQELIVANKDDGLFKLTSAYHLSEINQNEKIIKTATRIIWAGFVVICAGVILAMFGKTSEAIITSSAGVLTDAISAVIFAFVSMSNKSKLKYFEQLSSAEEYDKLMQMITILPNKKAQEHLLDKMVTNYCERRKSK